MKDVQFGVLSALNDLRLILNDKTISAPSIKTVKTDVPGADGELDFTEYFGDVHYNNRKLTFNFSTIINQSEFLTLFSYIQNVLHGKAMKIYLSDDPGFYYYGRVNVNEWKSNKRIGKIVIEVDAEPYKYKEDITTITRTIAAQTSIACSNLRKHVVPKITVTGQVSITFGTYTKTFSAGEYTDDDLIFIEGINTLVVSPVNSSATIKIEYQERGL